MTDETRERIARAYERAAKAIRNGATVGGVMPARVLVCVRTADKEGTEIAGLEEYIQCADYDDAVICAECEHYGDVKRSEILVAVVLDCGALDGDGDFYLTPAMTDGGRIPADDSCNG
jgi:hypothetical protein